MPGEELHGRQQLTKNCLAGLFQMLREIDISAFVKTFEVFRPCSRRMKIGAEKKLSFYKAVFHLFIIMSR